MPSTRTLTLETAARDYVWLWDLRHGASIQRIASRDHATTRRVEEGIERARASEHVASRAEPLRVPRLLPMFPITFYTPLSVCPHRGPIRPGSHLCCMVCHASGIDDHPAFAADAEMDPTPEQKPAPPDRPGKAETRRQRRLRLFGAVI